jgi:hypothetical protein
METVRTVASLFRQAIIRPNPASALRARLGCNAWAWALCGCAGKGAAVADVCGAVDLFDAIAGIRSDAF